MFTFCSPLFVPVDTADCLCIFVLNADDFGGFLNGHVLGYHVDESLALLICNFEIISRHL